MVSELTTGRIRAARIIAVAADLIQLNPALWGGVMNPADDAIDVLVAIILSYLVGWHWQFLPTFVMELVPVVEFAPTWTIAVLIATRKGATQAKADLPPSARKPGATIDVEIEK